MNESTGTRTPHPGNYTINHPIRGILPIISRPLIDINNDEEHYEALENRQIKYDKNQGTPRNYVSIPTGSTVVVQHKNGGPWTHCTVEGKGDHNHHKRIL